MAQRFLVTHIKNRLKIALFYFTRRSLPLSGFKHESSCRSALKVADRIQLTSQRGLSLYVFVARCIGSKVSDRPERTAFFL